MTVDGDRLEGTATLTHALLPAPFFTPADGAEVDPNNVIVEWEAVAGAAAYSVEIEQDDLEVNVTAELNSDTLSFAVPAGFLVPGVKYEVGVATVTDDGNVAVAESAFTTSNREIDPLSRVVGLSSVRR